MKKLNVFWHVCMINDWSDILTEQMYEMIAAGLYERCENIFLSAVGNADGYTKLKTIIEGNRKFVIAAHNPDIKTYEFFTLRFLRDKSFLILDDFYGLYGHTKGCSYPGHAGGKVWRDYLTHHMISRWKEHVANLDTGYELSGTQIRTARIAPALKLHYSGNFFFFRSEYIRTLPAVENLDHSNRYNAELWVCGNHPVLATVSQEWIDYNSKTFTKLLPL